MAATQTRTDYGEHIPGARKHDNGTALKVLDDLGTMAQSDFGYPADVVIAKLTEIRRDDVWGSLNSRLAQLQSENANPALALAWRVLYRSFAASAASTEVKPTTTTSGRLWVIPPYSAYVFGHIYTAVLTRIEMEMEQIPPNTSWLDINKAMILSPPSKESYSGFFAGIHALEEIQKLLPNHDSDTSFAVEKDVPEAVAHWLDQEQQRGQALMGLVRTRGRDLSQRLRIAKSEVFRECVVDYEAHLRGVIDELVLKESWLSDTKVALRSWLRRYVDDSVTGTYCPDNIHTGIRYQAIDQYLDDPIAVGDEVAREVYARVVSDASFNPFRVPLAKKTSTAEADTGSVENSDAESFESILHEKVMPPTRFEHLGREVSGGGPSPRVGNVSEAELCELVPFRGIQYGNWATQSERQEMLNLAYDAMSDLALALGVSTQYLALPLELESGVQNLGLALGARGRGGSASAHYEPARHVINLTKTKGGGALAHEWMHGYDHKVAADLHLGCDSASAIAGNPVYEFVQLLRQAIPEAREQALASAVAHKRDLMLEAVLPSRVEAELARSSGGVSAWRVVGVAMSETIAKWATHPTPVIAYACTGHQIDYEVVIANMASGLVEHGVPETTANALATLWASRTSGATWIKLDRVLRRDPVLHRGQSEYLAQAQLLNGAKATGYWTTPTELFARAGSAVVFDRLRDLHGVVNGFLAESSNPELFDAARHKGNPNPAGVEREVFAKAFSNTLAVKMLAEDGRAQVRQQEVVVGARRQMRLF
ncbi:LPD1 domain-containing protein [Ferrimicrobium sp.]|uniref:LPD1 domain-containing protein n=1 Tax=Ferrimicrobium sp. TaxID=2926050 RepID=UPI00261D31AC|nr:LPD1 domain-containing protein [Ferrimicrobium sp.]